MYQIVVTPFERKHKISKKRLLDILKEGCKIPAEQIEKIETEKTEQGYVYTVNVRG